MTRWHIFSTHTHTNTPTHSSFEGSACLISNCVSAGREREGERRRSGEAGRQQSCSRESTSTRNPLDSTASMSRGEAASSDESVYKCVMSHGAVQCGVLMLSRGVWRRSKGEACEGKEGLRYEATGTNPTQHLSCCHGGLPQPEQKAIGQLSREAKQHVRGVLLFTTNWVCLWCLFWYFELCTENMSENERGLETSRLYVAFKVSLFLSASPGLHCT